MADDYLCIGKAADRQEATDKVTGRIVYAGDIYLPGMLHGVALRSPYPHARILGLDTSAARALPGVRAVLTAADLPRKLVGERVKDVAVLAMDRVRYVGEKVAVVAAVNAATARRATRLIKVEYEPLPAVFEITEAMAPDAPAVHEDLREYSTLTEQVQGNVYAYERLGRGNLDEGWAQSDFIFEDTFRTQSVHQGHIERHAAVVSVEHDGRATIWTSNKQPFRLRRFLAKYLGLPENHLRVVAPCVGGDFGGKGPMMDEPLCYFLSRATGRPVRMDMRRNEELSAANPRHPSLITIKSGVKKSGELVARQCKVIFNSGAYGGVKPGAIVGYSKSAGPYRIPHVLIEGYSVYTNNNPCGLCRSPGDVQSVFAVESHTDLVAKRLGMDPLAFRMLNVLQDGEDAPSGERWKNMRGREVLAEVVCHTDWHGTRPAGTGKGLALAYRDTTGGESGAIVMVNGDGSVEILTGATETGTGNWTILRQVAAEELGVNPDRLRIVPGDTAVAPFDRGSGGSHGTHIAGRAVQLAARDAAQCLKAVAATMLNCPVEKVVVTEERFSELSHPEQHCTFAEVAAKACEKGTVLGKGNYLGTRGNTTAFAAHLAEVNVDRASGRIEVTRLVAVHDIGCVMNPPAAEGQVEGAIVQGLGFVLWEELAKNEGKLWSPYLADYHQPTSLDMPEMEVVFLEGALGPGPYGAKGLGEIALNPVAAAIANAIRDAAGVQLTDLPFVPEKFWRAINTQGANVNESGNV